MYAQKIEAQNQEEDRLNAYALGKVSAGGSGICRISQKAFDDIVDENVEEFEMSKTEAIKETIGELKIQGADLRDVIVEGMSVTDYLKKFSDEGGN